jgi:hypothetical protein
MTATRGRRARRRRGLARFVDAFGWRAYAIPVLSVATVLCVGNIASGSPGTGHGGVPSQAGQQRLTSATQTPSPRPGNTPSSHPTPSPGPTPTKSPTAKPSPTATASPNADTPKTAPTGSPTSAAALPAGAAYVERGDGRFHVVAGQSAVHGTGPLRRYNVEVENGVDADAAGFARRVDSTLDDPRSWIHGGDVSLQRVDSGKVDFHVTLTSSMTVRSVCGYTIHVETSCFNGAEGRAFINDSRWMRGAVGYSHDLTAYRSYVVNHEVGHALGHHHMKCAKAGTPAPTMMEQTLGLSTPGVGACAPNPWPYLDGHLVTGPPTA